MPFEVSSVIHTKVMEGSDYLKSRSRDLGHALFGVIHLSLRGTRHGQSNKENVKSLASAV